MNVIVRQVSIVRIRESSSTVPIVGEDMPARPVVDEPEAVWEDATTDWLPPGLGLGLGLRSDID